eukprot:TRINITY_DN370_c0_g1_i19.p1 TRINITY_DN370_c0_g1~~TRINITY_DN370_c0_g1_i19.p1  ORF type:complete len:317 (+),score=-5.95 TRINITY_DN370_c0_g1_i19:25-951(+)
MIRRPPRSTPLYSSAASDVYKRQVVGRGGMIKPIESGTYEINESMIKDLNNSKASLHASSLGGLIASEIGKEHGIPSFIVDPVVVDELEPYSRLTGIPEISKESIFHALNAKSVAQKLAEEIGIKYEDLRLIVVHLGGGISVGAHRYGRVIDVNDGLQGDGPFTPERCGGVTLVPIIKMCFSGKYTQKEMEGFVTKNGGMFAYIGTNSLIEAEKMIMSGNKKASLVVESMAYQVCKEIGSMHVTLEGKVDAIILTGGLAYSDRFVGLIKDKVKFIAPVKVYPGENEMEALAQGALRVLKKEQKCKVYK